MVIWQDRGVDSTYIDSAHDGTGTCMSCSLVEWYLETRRRMRIKLVGWREVGSFYRVHSLQEAGYSIDDAV